MATEVRMPKLGLSMKKGVVIRWLRAEGDEVAAGDKLLEIATEKVNAAIQAPASGVLGKIVMPVKAEGPPGALIAYIGAPGETFPEVPETAPPVPAAAAPARAAAAPSARAGAPIAEVPASPAAKRLARDLGIDITQVSPSVPGKRVTTDDVERYAASPEALGAPAARGPVIPFEGMRRVIAERLTESVRSMAQVTITREMDASAVVARRRRLGPGFEAATGLTLSYLELLVQAVAGLLPKHPLINATLTEEGIVLQEEIHIGFAVAVEGGLLVPVIRDADRKTLAEIARARVELSERCQQGTIGLDELEGGTFTITNLGSFGADAFTPIVNPPQAAILGVGRIVERPVAVDGAVEVRPTAWLSLTFDHRIIDGAPAARFLEDFATVLESTA